jgi:hypothetical protein
VGGCCGLLNHHHCHWHRSCVNGALGLLEGSIKTLCLGVCLLLLLLLLPFADVLTEIDYSGTFKDHDAITGCVNQL